MCQKGDFHDELNKDVHEEAHQHFAKTLNGKIWELLQKPERSKQEDELSWHYA